MLHAGLDLSRKKLDVCLLSDQGEHLDQLAAGAATDAEAVNQAVSAFEDAGCDELVLFPCSSDPAQVGLLADALGN